MLCQEIKFGCESNSNATFQDLFSLEVIPLIFFVRCEVKKWDLNIPLNGRLFITSLVFDQA